jgi:hypothetical protein
MAESSRPNVKRLRQPVPWRPALQITDAGYPISKAQMRELLKSANRGQRGR